MEGFILINKPTGITSFGVISRLRKITGIKRIGHAGTLDPLASGLLICAIGRGATKKIDALIKKEKTYLAKIELGKTSNTYDMEGVVKGVDIKKRPRRKDIKKILLRFTGEIEQLPPIFSAKKINGERAYSLARKGAKVRLKKNKVFIKKIKIVSYRFPLLKIRVECGSGTYIRSLANDIGEDLKTGAVLSGLVRECIGKYSLRRSLKLESVNISRIKKAIFWEI